MDFFSIIFIAIGLSMDAFAAAISIGLTMNRVKLKHALIIAIAFGGFQCIMPILGWLAGHQLRLLIRSIDHWIAFGALLLIGSKMIHEAISKKYSEKSFNVLNSKILLTLSVATSIDALVVGLSFAFLNTPILVPALLIGAVTFLISFLGVGLGQRFGCYLGRKMEIIGGLVLIAIGAKILIQHLFFNG